MWTEETLQEHLRSRGMAPELYNPIYCPEEGAVTFRLTNGAREWVGYQTYSPDKTCKKSNDPDLVRYYTYLPSGVDGVFGFDLVNPELRDIYIVEGVFKAGVLHRLGFNAVAVLTSHPKRMRPWFRILKATYNLIAIGDNDSAGQKLVNTIKGGLLSPKDLDEMKDEEIIELLGRARTP